MMGQNFTRFVRVFQGHETRQIDGHTGESAIPHMWYFEPLDYEGDVLWSSAFDTAEAAREASE